MISIGEEECLRGVMPDANPLICPAVNNHKCGDGLSPSLMSIHYHFKTLEIGRSLRAEESVHNLLDGTGFLLSHIAMALQV